MPTPRKYSTNAERQAAYRARAAAAASSAPLSAVPPAAGSRRWAMLIGQARGLLEGVAGEMTTYESARSDTWHDSERGERFMERLETLEESLDLLRQLVEA